MNTNVSGDQNIMRKTVYCVGLLALALFRVFFDEMHSIFRSSDKLQAYYPRSEPDHVETRPRNGGEVDCEVYRQLTS